MANMSFCTVVNCTDGRVQIPVINFLLERFRVSYVDVITELAPNKILSEKSDHARITCIMQRLNVSVLKHGSKGMAVVGHYDCESNPASKKQQMDQLEGAVAFLKDSYPDVEVIGLWLASQWQVDEVC
jgi:hypothetical protein